MQCFEKLYIFLKVDKANKNKNIALIIKFYRNNKYFFVGSINCV